MRWLLIFAVLLVLSPAFAYDLNLSINIAPELNISETAGIWK